MNKYAYDIEIDNETKTIEITANSKEEADELIKPFVQNISKEWLQKEINRLNSKSKYIKFKLN